MTDAIQQHTVKVGETRNFALDLRGKLDAGELLVGTPTVVELTTAHLSINNKNINSAERIINGLTVPVAQAVVFKVSGFQTGVRYRIQITIGTDAVPAQTIIEHIVVRTTP